MGIRSYRSDGPPPHGASSHPRSFLRRRGIRGAGASGPGGAARSAGLLVHFVTQERQLHRLLLEFRDELLHLPLALGAGVGRFATDADVKTS